MKYSKYADHIVNVCTAYLKCPNLCDEEALFSKVDLEKHLSEGCPLSMIECPNCNLLATKKQVEESNHDCVKALKLALEKS